jgi:ATP-binding cassette subfamily B protein RaxB
MEMLNFAGGRSVPLVRQAEASECGLACLAMIAAYHGFRTDLIALRRRFPISLKGATLRHLVEMAEALGFSTRPLRAELPALPKIGLPAILHWDLNHFVVLTRVSQGVRGTRYHIQDPATGTLSVGEAEFSRRFTGVLLELVKSETFRPQVDRTQMRLNQLWSRIEGFWPALRQLFLLSAVIQLAALVSPFFLQISIDTVLPSFDADLLLVLAIGFGGVALVSMVTAWVRSLVIVRLGASLSYQVTVNLFRHLLRLPLPWFERRHVGDIVSRFGSTKTISDALSQGLIAAFIDGIMAIVTLALMFVYSSPLALLALAALSIVICLRFSFFAALRHANVNMITAAAVENSAFIEAIRGIATIKAFGEESNRQRYWQQRKADAVNAEIKTGRLNAGFNAGEQFLMAIERVLFVYISIQYAITAELTVGMIFALQSYRQQFLDATTRLIQQGISYRLLDMHLARISDIALSTPEPIADTPRLNIDRLETKPRRIELRNVRFHYGPNEPEVLQGINLDLSAGEMVAFIGPSGGGKTTLLKIMMGLLPPSHGEVLIDGVSLANYGIGRWRREIGSVAQDDALFSGSLADNICMFDPEPDNDRMIEAAKAARIHEDIISLPMSYHTPVGDMGSVLSGGQKQRVMLARAFYRQPSVLFLDEATAHLDSKTEMEVGEAMQSLRCTRVVIAHRPQTIQRADRLFAVTGGRCQLLQGRADLGEGASI